MSDAMNPGGNDNPPPDDSNDKFKDQIDLLVAEFGDEIEIDPPNWRDVGVTAIYRTGSVLVREHDLSRTLDRFGGGRVRRGRLGVSRVDLPAAVPADAPGGDGDSPTQRFLAHADRLFGRGTVTPDHLFYICKSVSPCPATEPEEVAVDAVPDPFLTGVGKADGRGVKIVVLDVGWTPAPHADWLNGVVGDLEVAIDPQTNLIRPYAGHGTFIAGVVRSIAPNAEVVVKSYFDKAGAMFEVDLADRLDDAMAEDPDIISLSAGSKTRFDQSSLAFDAFTRPRLGDPDGPVLVAAAGNDGDDRKFWPAAYPETVSVGALAADETTRASFSNYGNWVDVYAPGEDFVNAFVTGTYVCTEHPNKGDKREFGGMAKWSGTSFSTPLVAGLIAARMSLTGERPKKAANALLAYSKGRVLPQVGPVLLPGDARASTVTVP